MVLQVCRHTLTTCTWRCGYRVGDCEGKKGWGAWLKWVRLKLDMKLVELLDNSILTAGFVWPKWAGLIIKIKLCSGTGIHSVQCLCGCRCLLHWSHGKCCFLSALPSAFQNDTEPCAYHTAAAGKGGGHMTNQYDSMWSEQYSSFWWNSRDKQNSVYLSIQEVSFFHETRSRNTTKRPKSPYSKL